MRAKGSIFIVAAIVAVAAILGYALFRGGTDAAKREPAADSPEDAFLGEVRKLQAAAPAKPAAASLPPVDADQTMVGIIDTETRELDLGVIRNDEIARTTLKIYNRGKAPLRITEIKTSCVCTMGHLRQGQETVLPGSETEIDVTVDPRRILGFHSRKVLTIYSSDPASPTLEVGVTANVDPEYEIEPADIAFGEVPKGESRKASILLRQIWDTPIELKDVNTIGPKAGEGDPGGLRIQFAKRPESEWKKRGKVEYTIDVELLPDAPPGDFFRNIFIVTDVPRLPTLRQSVTAKIVSPYTLSPAPPTALTLRKAEGAEGFESGTATITADQPLEISGIQAPTSLAATARPGGGNTVYLDVAVTADAPRGRLEEEVLFTIVSGGKSYPERLGVRAFVTRNPAAGGAG